MVYFWCPAAGKFQFLQDFFSLYLKMWLKTVQLERKAANLQDKHNFTGKKCEK